MLLGTTRSGSRADVPRRGRFRPLALLGIHVGSRGATSVRSLLGGLAMGLRILGSHGQHALHLLIFCSLWISRLRVRDREARPFILKGGGLFVVTSLGVGAAAILTRMDSLANGLRIPGEDLPLHYGDPWRLPLYLAGMAIGKVCHPADNLLRSEFTLQAGVLATALAVAGAVRNFRDPWIRLPVDLRRSRAPGRVPQSPSRSSRCSFRC
jgi:hypothetical protein